MDNGRDYSRIDMKRTGRRIQRLLNNAGYTVRQIQAYLHLACPQSIYRWFHGEKLPNIEHLYALSVLLGIHMEDFIIPFREEPADPQSRRLMAYLEFVI